MIAYHFPPLTGSSGMQRTLRFVQHLPALGWEPVVLTASRQAYEQTSDDLMSDIPPGTVVSRAFALDTARHLQIGGRYFGWMARPDRWISWRFAGVRQGLKLIEALKPQVIWSTYPIATAHVIAAALHAKTGLPWIADFRDPMAQDGYPADPATHRLYAQIEANAAATARYCVFTTPGAANDYKQRYPAATDRMVVVENGFDEETFAEVRGAVPSSGSATPMRPLLFLHSGIVYPSERDPTQLFIALGHLRSIGQLGPQDLIFRFRASGHDEMIAALARANGVQDIIELEPAIPYRAALAEMMSADALLVMQASNCNSQIPAKIYEYLRAGRPIVALTDPAGDTAGVMRAAGLPHIVRLDSSNEIEAMLLAFLREYRAGGAKAPDPVFVEHASRRSRAVQLEGLLNLSCGRSPDQTGAERSSQVER
jgi:hypothetical protein